MYILGIWDGHDSGAAVIKDDRILAAINEERLTRRKLEIRFPARSVMECLRYCNLQPGDIKQVAVSTFDVSKTMARILPSTKEEYYLIRRRKKAPGLLSTLKKRAKYKLTELPANRITARLSAIPLKRTLDAMGFAGYRMQLVDHHRCHAAGQRCSWRSGYPDSLCAPSARIACARTC